MIQIDRSKAVVPAILVEGVGKAEANKIRSEFDAGKVTFSFNTRVYGHKSVKTLLRDLQHSKCCFCETKIDDNHGDVEHFRPKAGYQIEAGGPLLKPGYYWLAYEYSNLFFSCVFCNQVHKKNLFPLLNEAERAKSHHDDITRESSLLLHPEHDTIDERLLHKVCQIRGNYYLTSDNYGKAII